jgi:hypothetical protein
VIEADAIGLCATLDENRAAQWETASSEGRATTSAIPGIETTGSAKRVAGMMIGYPAATQAGTS